MKANTLSKSIKTLLVEFEKFVAQYESEIRSEYDGTAMLEGKLADVKHIRTLIAKATHIAKTIEA